MSILRVSPMAKKRRSPRKRALTQAQVIEQLRRYQRLFGQWLDEQGKLVKRLAEAQRRIKKYRDKTLYYQDRLEEQAGDAVRALRAIQVDETAAVVAVDSFVAKKLHEHGRTTSRPKGKQPDGKDQNG